MTSEFPLRITRTLTTEDLVLAARATVPLSRTAPEKIQAVRDWAKTRARPAGLPDVMIDASTVVAQAARALDVEIDQGKN